MRGECREAEEARGQPAPPGLMAWLGAVRESSDREGAQSRGGRKGRAEAESCPLAKALVCQLRV